MRLFRHSGPPPLPLEVRAALGDRVGRVLAWGPDSHSGGAFVVGQSALALVSLPGGMPSLSATSPVDTGDDSAAQAPDVEVRPWHLVDGGSWDPEAFTLTITWVDGRRPTRVVLREDSPAPEAFRERVQASVVLADQVDLGPKRRARVVVRRDLASGDLLGQTIFGRGTTADEQLRAAAKQALNRLKEQVGLA